MTEADQTAADRHSSTDDELSVPAARIYVWDLPTRMFHWLLLLLVCISFATGLTGGFETMDYHMLSGYGILSLVLFRLIWGFIGNQNARFATFLTGPAGVLRYLRHSRVMPYPGHNPLGGLSIIAMLTALLVQAVTGLFANDDILLEGPLVHLVSAETSYQLTDIHGYCAWLIAGLIGLHLVAIAYYQIWQRDALIQPMLSGWRMLNQPMPSASNPWLRGLIAFIMVGSSVYYLVHYV